MDFWSEWTVRTRDNHSERDDLRVEIRALRCVLRGVAMEERGSKADLLSFQDDAFFSSETQVRKEGLVGTCRSLQVT